MEKQREQKVTIVSHLKPAEWKLSWEDKVVEDTEKNKVAYQQKDCFWGHFNNNKEFTLCFHRDSEIKSMSLSLYFNGRIDKDPQGSRITGTFDKKRSANVFLIVGAILCVLAAIGSYINSNMEVLITSLVLLLILIFVFNSRPKRERNRIIEHLKKISFDEKFYNAKIKKGKIAAAAAMGSTDKNSTDDDPSDKESANEKIEDAGKDI